MAPRYKARFGELFSTVVLVLALPIGTENPCLASQDFLRLGASTTDKPMKSTKVEGILLELLEYPTSGNWTLRSTQELSLPPEFFPVAAYTGF